MNKATDNLTPKDRPSAGAEGSAWWVAGWTRATKARVWPARMGFPSVDTLKQVERYGRYCAEREESAVMRHAWMGFVDGVMALPWVMKQNDQVQ